MSFNIRYYDPEDIKKKWAESDVWQKYKNRFYVLGSSFLFAYVMYIIQLLHDVSVSCGLSFMDMLINYKNDMSTIISCLIVSFLGGVTCVLLYRFPRENRQEGERYYNDPSYRKMNAALSLVIAMIFVLILNNIVHIF